MSEDREEREKQIERYEAVIKWLNSIRKTAPVETQIDLIFARLDDGEGHLERDELRSQLAILLHQIGQHDEALRLADDRIAESPDDVYAYIGKSRTYHRWLEDPDSALDCIELAVACARRTGKWQRVALGFKARILVDMRRGDALSAVLEEIMAVKVTRDVVDIGRERDFVDAAPPGLISPELLARYDAFCPPRAGDTPHELPKFDVPEFGPDGQEIPVKRPR